MKKLSVLLCTSVMLLGICSTAGALTINAIDGNWTGTTGGVDVNYISDVPVAYGNLSEDQVKWGESRGFGQSGLGFTGSAAPDKTFDLGDAFDIGQLRHFNRPIGLGTSASEAFLAVSMEFVDPSGLNEAFNFDFGINETPNNPGPPASDDTITFLSEGFSETFEYDGVNYLFELLGFGSDADNLMYSFTSPEGYTNSTLLWGKITSSGGMDPVPEPATMILFGAGLVSLVSLRLRKKK